jgi:membrane protease subunit (stomatin/prohibitin family)
VTDSPVQLQDPRFGVMVPVRSYGQYGVEIADSKKFLLRLVGTLPSFEAEPLKAYFRGKLLTQIKTEVAKTIVSLKVSVLEVGTMLSEVSSEMHRRLTPHFGDYGILLSEFNVHSINVPEDDAAVKSLKAALAKRAEMGIIGFNYQQERQFDVLETAAGNEGGAAAPIMGAGIGLGAGLGIGSGIGSAMGALAGGLGGGMLAPGPSGNQTQAPHSMPEKIEFLKKLAELRDTGILTAEEFDAEKKRILESGG